ncbi:MAG TPA: peptidoglycan-binding domain-containing protein [Stellaceae bacterium]|nr:peptidoglycan-binding domain-containing protein [Stellaceae bacterium]
MRRALPAACLIALVHVAAAAPGEAASLTLGATSVTAPLPQRSRLLLRVADAQHQRVAQAQRRLRALGLYHGTTNGTLGPQTRSALSVYQQKLNLPVTGQLDQVTAYSLENNELVEVCAAHGMAASACLGAIEQFRAMVNPSGGTTPPASADRIVRQACAGAQNASDCADAVAKMDAWLNARATAPK